MAVTVTMPQLGETITEGTILSWAKQPGDTVEADEVLLEISTDKVDTEVPSPLSGVVQEILVAEGETVTVGTPLAVIAEAGEGAEAAPAAAAPAEAAPAPAAPVPEPEETPAAEEPAPAEPATPQPASPEPAAAPVAAAPAVPDASSDAPRRAVLSPVVRRLAVEHGIDLNLVAGTGEGGRITRKDIMTLIDAGVARAGAGEVPPPAPTAPPAPSATVSFEPATTPPPPSAPPPVAPPATVAAPPGSDVRSRQEEIPRIRKVIAENMARAKRTAAHVWTSVEVDYTRVEQVRQSHRAAWKQREGFSLTYLPFIARATIDALAAYPVVNSAFNLEEGTQVFHQGVELGIAVDMNQTGLVVMTLRGSEGLTMTGLARGIRALADKARDGKLALEDLEGSTFTITNPGPFGSFMSAPIINVPNVAILSTDTVAKRPAVVTLPDGTDTLAIRHIGYLGLTWDHRVFDGSTAVLFLSRIKQNLESWDWEQELT